MLRHVKWERGIVAIKMDEIDRVTLKTLAGPDLPAKFILSVLEAGLPDYWMSMAENLHQARRHPWIVETYTGMSGCQDYSLYVLRDEEFVDQPKVASLHVSMNEKLNKGLHCWLGDLPPLLAAMLEDYPPEETYVAGYEPTLREYKNPGETSSLQETLASFRAMEAIAEE